jgi:hypothetical protein
MIDKSEIPASLERAMMMENLMTARATGLGADSAMYELLRREFMASETLKPLLPDFVPHLPHLGCFLAVHQRKGRNLT